MGRVQQTVEIRLAQPGEETAIAPLYEWLFAQPGTRPATWDESRAALALRHAIDADDACVLVAAVGEELIGFGTCYRDLLSVRFGTRVWVEDLAVDPQSRSQGVGSLLLEAAKTWARDCGATHLELDSADTRTDAHRFYEREGAYRSTCFGWEL